MGSTIARGTSLMVRGFLLLIRERGGKGSEGDGDDSVEPPGSHRTPQGEARLGHKKPRL